MTQHETQHSDRAFEQYGRRGLAHFDRSIQLQEDAVEHLPEATSSNYRGSSAYAPFPMIYMDEANGVTLTDVDGNEYIDFHCGVSSIISGHNPEQQRRAVREQLERGPYFATTYELEYETAKIINDIIPGSERVKFTSTGTEAIMSAIRLARAYTGKEKILTFEGMYHGHTNDALVNVHPPVEALGSRRNPHKIPETAGIPGATLEAVESIPWNDTDLLAEKLAREGDDIAAVITEATMSNSGLLWPTDGYLDQMRALTAEHDVLLILDEVVTGFRLALGGAQEYFGIRPDIAIYGKALANGYPCAAVTGRLGVMEYFTAGPDRTTFMGTFSGHPINVAATRGNLEVLLDLGTTGYTRFLERGENFVAALREIFADAGEPVFIPDFAGFTYIHFLESDDDPTGWTEWRDIAEGTDPAAYEQFASGMVGEGMFFPPKVGRINLTHAHTDDHLEPALEAAKSVLE